MGGIVGLGLIDLTPNLTEGLGNWAMGNKVVLANENQLFGGKLILGKKKKKKKRPNPPPRPPVFNVAGVNMFIARLEESLSDRYQKYSIFANGPNTPIIPEVVTERAVGGAYKYYEK